MTTKEIRPATSPLSNKAGITHVDLGVLGGDKEYVTQRVHDLLDTFNNILKFVLTRTRTTFDQQGNRVKKSEYTPLTLRYTPRGMSGHTDCKTFISVPVDEYDGLLVAEHELSHILFKSDLGMLQGFQLYVIQKIFTRAGIPMASSEAALYKPGLEQCFFQCWNLLEDLRVRNHWSKIYEGSGHLLLERWKRIAASPAYDVAKDNIIAYVARTALGIDTPDCNPVFKKFDEHIKQAADTAIHTNSKGCIAITARLFQKIAEVIMQDIRDNPQGEGNGGGQGGTNLWKKTIVVLSSKSRPVNVSGMPGADDIRSNNSSPYGQQFRGRSGRGREIKRVDTNSTWTEISAMKKMVDRHAKQKSNLPPNVPTDFERLLEEGEQEMEDLVDNCIDAMIEEQQQRLADAVEEEETDYKKLVNFEGAVGIKCVDVDSSQSKPLPKHSTSAEAVRYELQKIKSQMKHRLAEEGDDLIVEEHIDAKLNRELPDADIFEETIVESGFDVLLLVDVSGSMSGTGMEVVNQTVADIQYAIENTKTTLKVWGFSTQVYILDKAASLQNPNVWMGGTAMIRSLDMAYEWAKLNKSKRAILLVTDGWPSYCRARRSTGDAQKDLENVMKELEMDGIPISTVAVGGWGTYESNIKMYDKIFGKGKYGYVDSVHTAGPAIVRSAQALVSAFLKRRG